MSIKYKKLGLNDPSQWELNSELSFAKQWCTIKNLSTMLLYKKTFADHWWLSLSKICEKSQQQYLLVMQLTFFKEVMMSLHVFPTFLDPNCDIMTLEFNNDRFSIDFHLIMFLNYFCSLSNHSCLETRTPPILPTPNTLPHSSLWLLFCCGESIFLVNTIFLWLLCHLFLYWIVFHFISLVCSLLNL